MSLPSAWVDRVFEKLTVAYGQRFLSNYAGIDIGAVKADWADELAGFQQSPNSIKYGLEHLPAEFPPTAIQFRDICRKTPQGTPKALPAPEIDPAVVQAVKASFKPVVGSGDRAWIDKLRQRIERREIRPTKYQRDALAELSE